MTKMCGETIKFDIDFVARMSAAYMIFISLDFLFLSLYFFSLPFVCMFCIYCMLQGTILLRLCSAFHIGFIFLLRSCSCRILFKFLVCFHHTSEAIPLVFVLDTLGLHCFFFSKLLYLWCYFVISLNRFGLPHFVFLHQICRSGAFI